MANANEQLMIQQTRSTLKISLNVIIGLLIMAVLLLMQWFVFDNGLFIFQSGLEYWVWKAITAIATFLLMISASNVVEESRNKKDKEYVKKLLALDSHYSTVHEKGETENLEILILNLNKQAKFDAYVRKIKKKIQYIIKHTKDKDVRAAKIEPYEEKLILSVDEVWDEVNVKYNEVTSTELWSGAVEIHESENDANDLHTHRPKNILTRLIWKFIFVVAFGIMTADATYHFEDFTREDIVPLLFRIGTMLWSIYCGVTFGFYMHDQVMIVLKKKLRILSIFRNRQDGNKDFTILPRGDILIDKARNKYGLEPLCANYTKVEEKTEELIKDEINANDNALKKTWNDTFGAGTPVKPGTFAGELLKNALQAEAEKNIN